METLPGAASTALRSTLCPLSICHSYHPKTQSFTLRQPASPYSSGVIFSSAWMIGVTRACSH